MLILDTLGYRIFKITPSEEELAKNPVLKTLIFEAEPYIMAKGDEIKLEFHLYQKIDKQIVPAPEINTGGMGSQDNIGVPGVSEASIGDYSGMSIPNPLAATSLHLYGIGGTSNNNSPETPCLRDSSGTSSLLTETEHFLELNHHHKQILEFTISYLDIQFNGFKDWLSPEDCITKLYADLKPVTPDNYLISDIIKRLSSFVKQDSIETRLFTPVLLVSSEYQGNFEFLYNKAQGICHRFQNQVSVYIDIEATHTILTADPSYQPADIIKIGGLPYQASSILHQTFVTKPFVGYSPVQHSIHAIIAEGSDYIQIIKTGDTAPGVREARWGIDIASDKIKFIMEINYIID